MSYPPYHPQISPPRPVMHAAVDASGRVIGDLICRKCSYNLRTLNLNSRCPECGTSVGYSVQGDLLRFCDPDWVDTLRNGMTLMLSGICVLILYAIISAATGSYRRGGHPSGFALFLRLIGNVLMVVGSWLLTTPDPSGLGEDQYGTPRKIIRVTLVIGMFSTILSMIEQTFVIPPDLHMGIVTVQWITSFSGLVGEIATLRYLSKLALRISNNSISNTANALMWSIGISYGLILVQGILLAISVGQKALAPTLVFGCGILIAGLVLLVCGIIYLIMLEKFRRALKEQALYALRTWAAQAVVRIQPM